MSTQEPICNEKLLGHIVDLPYNQGIVGIVSVLKQQVINTLFLLKELRDHTEHLETIKTRFPDEDHGTLSAREVVEMLLEEQEKALQTVETLVKYNQIRRARGLERNA